MDFKLVLILITISWIPGGLVDAKCPTIGNVYTLNSKIAAIKIGGNIYNSYTGKYFNDYGATVNPATKISKYPFKQTYPEIYLETNSAFYETSDRKVIDILINQTLTDVEVGMNINNVFIIVQNVAADTCNYIYMLYNDDQTVLYAKFVKTPPDLYFNLGKDLGSNMVYDKLAKVNKANDTYVFDVTSVTLRQFGCIRTRSIDSRPNFLEMNMYRLSNLGSEYIWFRGPCVLDDEAKAIKTIIFQHKTVPMLKFLFDIKYDANTNRFICGFTPIIWYTGQYKGSIKLMGQTFQVEIDVYENTEVGIDIYEQAKLDSAVNYVDEFQLNIKLPANSTDTYVLLRILQFSSLKGLERPYEIAPAMAAKGFKCYGLSGKCTGKTMDLFDEYTFYDHNRIMGYFEAYSNEKSYKSKIISLLWMSLNPNNKFTKTFMNGQLCQSYLSVISTLYNDDCPVSLDRIKTVSSTFELLKTVHNNLECFLGYFFRAMDSGITCCYNSKSRLLVTGASNFFSGNNLEPKLSGSYRWAFIPTIQPHLHFVFDRIPLLSCCTNFDKYDDKQQNTKNYLCNEYWNKFHNISAVKSPLDYTGDLFGDPHVIGFSSRDIQYSYLFNGFYSLFQVKDKLEVIGLFYAGSDVYKTVLQYLIIKLDKNYVLEVIPIQNKAGTLSWTILNAGTEVETLPFYTSIFMISQSADRSILSIYTTNSNKFTVRMDLTGHSLFKLPYSFMDFRMFVQVPNKNSNIRLGGLFGTVNTTTGDISLNPKSSSSISSYDATANTDEIVKSWKVESADVVAAKFFTVDEIKILNKPSSKPTFSYKADPKCKGVKFCDIDIFAYPDVDIYQSTLDTVAKRSNYGALEKKSEIVPEYCVYPSFKDWIFDNVETSIGSISNVIGCYNPTNIFIGLSKVKITCTKSELPNETPYWKVSISNWRKVCVPVKITTAVPVTRPTLPSSNPKVFYIIGGVFSGFILINIIVGVLIFVVFKKRRQDPPYELQTREN